LGHVPPTTFSEYGAADQLLAVVDPRGGVSRSEYDALGRIRAIWEAADYPTNDPSVVTDKFEKPLTQFASDAADRLTLTTVRVRNPLLQGQDPYPEVRTAYQYDPLDRKTLTVEAVSFAEERRSEAVYDPSGHPLKVTTGLSNTTKLDLVPQYANPHQTRYEYDPLGRVTLATEATNVEDKYLTKALGHSRPFTKTNYDAAGRVVVTVTNTATNA